MQVKAIYEDGVLNFSEPLRFKHRKFEVLVSIPEDELDTAGGELMGSVTTEVKSVDTYVPIGERLDGILGSYRGKLGNVTPQTVKEIWHGHLQEKHRDNK
jgi:predicted DNA-binding antitoxin AbrB/MazE fold protein